MNTSKSLTLDEILEWAIGYAAIYVDEKTKAGTIQKLKADARAAIVEAVEGEALLAQLKQAEDDYWAITHATNAEARALLRPRIKELRQAIKEWQ